MFVIKTKIIAGELAEFDAIDAVERENLREIITETPVEYRAIFVRRLTEILKEMSIWQRERFVPDLAIIIKEMPAEQRTIFVGELVEMIEGLPAEYQYRATAVRQEVETRKIISEFQLQFGSFQYGRVGFYELPKILQYRKDLENHNLNPDKPIVVMFYARDDYNGAFRNGDNKYMMSKILKNENQLLYFEMSHPIEMADNIDLLINNLPPEQKINFFFCGHGSQNDLELAEDERTLDKDAHDFIKGLRRLKIEKLVFVSCETGMGENSLAETLADYVTTDCQIYAPTDITVSTRLNFNSDTRELSGIELYSAKGINVTKIFPGRWNGIDSGFERETSFAQERLRALSFQFTELEVMSASPVYGEVKLKGPSEITRPDIGTVKINGFGVQRRGHSLRLCFAEDTILPVPGYGERNVEWIEIGTEKIGCYKLSESIEMSWLGAQVRVDTVRFYDDGHKLYAAEQPIKVLSPNNEEVEVWAMKTDLPTGPDLLMADDGDLDMTEILKLGWRIEAPLESE